jgi:lysozyme family protein
VTEDDFDRAFSYLLRDEGLYVNNPADPGGATKYGVTRETLMRWRGQPVTEQDVATLSREEAKNIYWAWYWKPLGCDELSKLTVATVLLDCGVLFGVGSTALIVQKTLNDSCGKTLRLDGFVGKDTINALNDVDARAFIEAFKESLHKRVSNIVRSNPSEEIFRKGWDGRIDRWLTLAV